MTTDEFLELIRDRVHAQSLGKVARFPETEAEISNLEEEWHISTEGGL
jgi:hypothetical protein